VSIGIFIVLSHNQRSWKKFPIFDYDGIIDAKSGPELAGVNGCKQASAGVAAVKGKLGL
jgi:hypothetical protein